MINQSSIKYISLLLSHPETITDADHSSIALFRQTFPYFVPARYIQAVEINKKSAFSPGMISEMQPYIGNWILFCNFLKEGSKVVKPDMLKEVASGFKDPGPLPVEKVPEFASQVAVSDAKAEVKAAPAKPVLAEEKVPPVVVPEIKTEVKAAPAKPVQAEEKVPPVSVPEAKTEVNAVPAKPVQVEEKAPPVVVSEIKTEVKAAPAKPVQAGEKAPPVVVPEIKTEVNAVPAKPVQAEEKTPPVVVPEIKIEAKAGPVKPVQVEEKAPPVSVPDAKAEVKAVPAKPVQAEEKTPPVVVPEIKIEAKAGPVKPVQVEEKAPPATEGRVEREASKTEPTRSSETDALITMLAPTKVIIKKQAEKAEEIHPVADTKKDEPAVTVVTAEAVTDYAEEVANDEDKDKLILPVYTEDYFLQQGVKISIDLPEEIEEFKAVTDEDDEDKSLMVMMSFSEWLLHFKNTSEQQKEEKKDQKALKTMWQKEKLAAALEEENEEIPENVFEMAVNSIAKEDGLASESLADIYIKQGKYDKAIEMYRKLSLRNPKKSTYFARRIEEVLKEKQS